MRILFVNIFLVILVINNNSMLLVVDRLYIKIIYNGKILKENVNINNLYIARNEKGASIFKQYLLYCLLFCTVQKTI